MNRIVRKMVIISILGMMVLSVFTGFAGANGDDRDDVLENTILKDYTTLNKTQSNKISSYLKYTLKQGDMEINMVARDHQLKRDGRLINTVEQKQVIVVKPLPYKIGGAIVTTSPLSDDQIKQLESLDVDIRSNMGTLVTVNMPTGSIDEMAELDFVRFIEGPKPVHMLLDVAIPEMGADQSWSNGYTGDDVVIGIVDSGIDELHGDFWFDGAKTDSKILYLWDQTDGIGTPPSGYSYGTEWTKAQIEAGSCTQNDNNGHGTHVAGIAAGTGLETGNYTGVAPDASIIFVKTTLNNIDIIDGMYYIVNRALVEGKPAVISLSLGGYFGPHDGSDPLAQAVDWCTSQGVTVVCAAGNEGDYPIHATIDGLDPYGGTYDTGDKYELDVALDPTNEISMVDIYYDFDDNISISVKTGKGLVSANEGDANGSGVGWTIDVHYFEGATYKNYLIIAQDNSLSYDEVIEIQVDNKKGGGVNRWDAWTMPGYEGFGSFTDPNDYDYFKNVGSPATAQTAIAVGAYTTKTTWKSTDGNTYSYTYAIMDELASFSSHGPTRDGRMKPEISASGFGVMSALSGDSSISPIHIDQDNAHRMNAGTSMACPMVSGAVALYLDYNSIATPSDIKNHFMNTAREDLFTGTTWPAVDNQYWGAGKVWAEIQPVHNLNTGENFETIQGAVYDSDTDSGDIVSVDPGTYNENVVVNKSLTIRSTLENSTDTIINASDSDDHVFNITADYVNITGFTVENATGSNVAGIYLGSGVDHCNISENNVTNNDYGIYLLSSSSNTLKNNTVNSNRYKGIDVSYSSNNILENNAVFNNYYGIGLTYSGKNILMNNTVLNNNYGIGLDSSDNNNITNSTLNANIWNGINLYDSSNNNITCNFVSHNKEHGFYLEGESIKNNISCNNIILNDNYNFYNNQSYDVNATGNWWGTNDDGIINISIYDWIDDSTLGNVTFLPKLDSPAPSAPIPELTSVTLFLMGLIVLLGYVWMIRRKD